jgi:hypothetical protein
MRSVILSLLVLAVLLAVPEPGRATARRDRSGLLETLARAQDECCPARNHGQYVSCAAHVCNRAVKSRIIRASDKVTILKHGCDQHSTTTTQPSTTTTTEPSTTTTTKPPTTTTTKPPTTTTTKPSTTTSTTQPPPTTTSTTEPTTTTSTTEPTTVTTSTTTSTTESTTTSTTEPETSSTTTSTTEPAAASTTTTTTPGPSSSTTSTTLPGPREICGNCIDDDDNGLTDFEDPACCSQLQAFSMNVSRGRLRPRGGLSRLRLKSLLARTGLQVNPLRQDVFLQIRPAGGTDLLCAKVPASKFMRMHGALKFWDRKHMVTSAKGINDLTVKLRRDGSVRFRTLGKRVQMQTPTHGPLEVTVGFHDPAGDAANRCSSTVQEFRTGRRGALLAP